jgi:hypothetical protein
MKSILSVIALLSLITCSCTRKDLVDNTVYVETPIALIGSWNWLYTSGGYAGNLSTPQSTGEIKRIEFNANNDFRYYINDLLKSEHKFQIETGKTITSQDNALIIKDILWIRQSISFRTTDTLVLFDECYDGYTHYFNRIK